ncbi:hypothetical protein E2C01_071491 [Portunus trituberculatus]|uniref:Uncharacterized protein n=1 Tax=Portunus trituberculatus TaxID=210409 RepID=A0A5B7HVH4_PORTR|nr:hypothetical protein [Portunus trituberculatus]
MTLDSSPFAVPRGIRWGSSGHVESCVRENKGEWIGKGKSVWRQLVKGEGCFVAPLTPNHVDSKRS